MVKNILIGMLIILTLSAIAFYLIFSPSYASSLTYNGQKITINRNQYGIPHIIAPNRRSYLYTLGHLIAEDRLYQVHFRRILSQGRLSEYLGQKTLKVDINMRDLGISKIAEHIANKMKKQDPESYEDLNAYAQGINDGVSKRKSYPIQFYMLGIKWQNWTVADSYGLLKFLQWTVSHGLVDQYTRSYLLSNYTVEQINQMLPIYKQHYAFYDVTTIKDDQIPESMINPTYLEKGDFQPLQIDNIISLGAPQYFVSAQGSNAWVVSGKHTQSGKPLLCYDPHLQSLLPSHWYQFKVSYKQNGKEVEFAGIVPPGIPTSFGKSNYFALGLTILNTDTQDAFKQKIEGNKYYFNNEWRPLKQRKQIIKVKTQSGVQQHNHVVKLTHRGPLLNYIISSIGIYDVGKDHLSVSWTGFNQDYTSLAYVSRNIQASTFQQLQFYFTQGNRYFVSISGLGITSDNHIFYFQSGLNPKRPSTEMASYIKDGTTSKYDWIGFMPFKDRLVVTDPQRGYIVTANNRPASQKFQGGYFDQVIFSARASRLEQILKKYLSDGNKVTNQYAISLLYDTVDIYCKQILPELNYVMGEKSKILHNFTCDFKSDSYQASIYQVFLAQLWKIIKPLPHNNISYLSMYPPYQALYQHIQISNRGHALKRKQMNDAWNNMEKQLEEFFNNRNHSTWKWGVLHKDIGLHMPLGPHPVFGKIYNRQSPGWGNLHTVNVGRASKIEHDNFATTHRANYRAVYDYGGPSWWINDGGISQNLLSSHYDDQWKLFIAEKLLPIDAPQKASQQL